MALNTEGSLLMGKKRDELTELYAYRDFALIPYSARQLEQLTGFSFTVWTEKDVRQLENALVQRRGAAYPVGVVWRFAHDYQLYRGLALYIESQPKDAQQIVANVRHAWSFVRDVAQVFIDGDS